jgi:hypothetical protein
MAVQALQVAVDSADEKQITKQRVQETFKKSHLLYDRAGEEHYNLASAMIKSLRGSDANAAVYWMGRMLAGGEDPLFIARRLVIFASEDVGMADVHALPLVRHLTPATTIMILILRHYTRLRLRCRLVKRSAGQNVTTHYFIVPFILPKRLNVSASKRR